MRQFPLYPYTLPTLHHNYCIAENFWGEKTLANFAVLWLFAKVFSAKFGGMVSFGTAWASNPQKFSPRKSYFHQFAQVFSLESFPLYGTVCRVCVISSFGLPSSVQLTPCWRQWRYWSLWPQVWGRSFSSSSLWWWSSAVKSASFSESPCIHT